MIEFLAVMALNYPRIFANEYCYARWVDDLDHPAAIEKAKQTWGGLQYSEEAMAIAEAQCPQYFQQEQAG